MIRWTKYGPSHVADTGNAAADYGTASVAWLAVGAVIVLALVSDASKADTRRVGRPHYSQSGGSL